jgi:hypothetical protein
VVCVWGAPEIANPKPTFFRISRILRIFEIQSRPVSRIHVPSHLHATFDPFLTIRPAILTPFLCDEWYTNNQQGRGLMMDILYLGITVLFFAISGWLLLGIDRL